MEKARQGTVQDKIDYNQEVAEISNSETPSSPPRQMLFDASFERDGNIVGLPAGASFRKPNFGSPEAGQRKCC